MKISTVSLILSAAVIFSLSARVHSIERTSAQAYLAGRAGELIKIINDFSAETSRLTLGGEPLYAADMLKRFYKRRNYTLAWIGSDGTFSSAETMLAAIEDVQGEGLMPAYYHRDRIKMLVYQLRRENVLNPEVMAELDVLLTDAFLMLGCHFSAGCIDPVTIEAEWYVKRNDLDVDILLDDALKEDNVTRALKDLLPAQGNYTKLKGRLMTFRYIVAEGGWQNVTAEMLLRKGVRKEEVVALRKRLIQSDDLTTDTDEDSPLFDDILHEAVIRFQRRHGLKPDGIVGPVTLSALNISAQRRLRQIEVNLERMRWLGRNLGHRYILVNIADFKLNLVDRDQQVMSMGVVAGKPFWNTPVFTERMKYIVLNPWWIVPESITKEELLPKIQMTPAYLTQNKMKMFSGWGKHAEEIDTASMSWDRISIEKFPYIIRQQPGPLNPLGRIKFMLPNRFNIYLHDTPAKGLFSESSRAFSHGCIRVEQPFELAEYLLKDDPDWDREKIVTAVKGGEETRIDLAIPITVHIVYLTSWVDDDGILHFRNDIYGRDDRLDKALRKKPEALAASMQYSS